MPLDTPIPATLATIFAVHEGVPGHHYQISIQFDSPTIPLARKLIQLPGFVEGWATYAETLSEDSSLVDSTVIS